MRYLLLLPALLTCRPAPAQTGPSTSPFVASAAPSQPAAPDTAAALHRLFGQKRHARTVVVAGTLAVGVGAFYGATQSYSLDGGTKLLAVSLVSLPVAAVELLVYHRYSRRHEQQALAAWQAHQLPPRLRKKLTADYFQPLR